MGTRIQNLEVTLEHVQAQLSTSSEEFDHLQAHVRSDIETLVSETTKLRAALNHMRGDMKTKSYDNDDDDADTNEVEGNEVETKNDDNTGQKYVQPERPSSGEESSAVVQSFVMM